MSALCLTNSIWAKKKGGKRFLQKFSEFLLAWAGDLPPGREIQKVVLVRGISLDTPDRIQRRVWQVAKGLLASAVRNLPTSLKVKLNQYI